MRQLTAPHYPGPKGERLCPFGLCVYRRRFVDAESMEIIYRINGGLNMHINKDHEWEINLKDCFFDLLYKWHIILAVAVIGALALGGFQYMRVEKLHNEGRITKQERQYQIDLQDYQDSMRNAQSNIRDYTKLIKEQTDYLEGSIYMSLDSQNEWFASKTYYIEMDQSVLDKLPENSVQDPADYAAAVYVSSLTSGLDPAEMETLMGTDNKAYIDELVSLKSDNLTNSLKLQVIGVDEATVAGQIAFFAERMTGISAQDAQAVGPHTLTMVSEDMGTRMDSDLANKKDQINKQITTWQKALQEQRQVLADLENDEEPTAPGRGMFRFGIIGFLAGACLVCLYYIVKYTVARVLRRGCEMTERYNIPVLGNIARFRGRNPGRGLNRLFEKMEFGRTNTDPVVVYETVSALFREHHAGKKLLLVGTIPESAIRALGDQLKKRLEGICEFAIQGDMSNNADAIAAANHADAVILVEQKYISVTDEIDREVKMLLLDKANVIGCIVM